MRNDIAFMEAAYAAQTLGAYAVPINWHFKAEEIGYILGVADAPVDPKPDWKPKSLLGKIEAGAQFAQTQFCMDAQVLRRYMTRLRESGVSARGIDLNDAMVAVCREQGFEATKDDALSFLSSLPPGSLGGLFAAQVVEHLEQAYLTRLLEAAFTVLRPGAPIVLETINPACWFAFFASYIRDITHVRPLHPDTLSYFVQASGFQRVTVRYRAPYPEHDKLQPVPADDLVGQTVNANVEKLNRLLFTYLDYAVVGERL